MDHNEMVAALDLELLNREMARRSLLPFIQLFHREYKAGWFHTRLCELLDDFILGVEQKKSPRLILTCPPRRGKSEIVSRKLPPYVLAKHPEWEWITATYGQDLSDGFGREVRELLNNPVYQDLFDVKLDPRSNAADFVRTKLGGMYKSTSIGGALTGMGAHILCIDDYCKDQQDADSQLIRDRAGEWYNSVARTRLHPGGGVIITATRWHVDDLIGRVLRDHSHENWIVYEFPEEAKVDELYRKKGEVLHPERYPASEAAMLKKSLPPRVWASMYQCSPYIEEGGFFQAKHFRTYQTLPEDTELRWLVAADYAVSTKTTADHTAVVALGVDHKGNVYIHPTIHYGRFESLDSVEKTIKLAKTLKSRVLATEKGPIQSTLEPVFRAEMSKQKWYVSLSRHSRTAAKHVHAHAFRARMEAGQVFFPEGDFYTHTLKPQLLQFMPESEGEDDLVDALANGFLALDMDVIPPPKPKEPEGPDETRDKDGRKIWTHEYMIARTSDITRNDEAPFRRLNGSAYKMRRK
jgi:hypothetical protein